MHRFLSSFVFVFVLICQVAVLSSCKKDSNSPANPDLATVSTDRVDAITLYSATVVSTVSKEGKSAVTGMGIAYGKNPNPTVVADKYIPYASFGVGTFSTSLDNLESGTTYYVRAYATNAAGTAYGNQLVLNTLEISLFNPNLTYGTMTDIDGNTYKTIIIGTQTWMAENLKTTKYRNGESISTSLSEGAWAATTGGAYAIYEDDTANNTTYGKLYNWYAVDDSRNLCPVGWHVPSDAEWTTLQNYLGGSSLAGAKLKSTSYLWVPYNKEATNMSGFSGLPAGLRVNEFGVYSAIRSDGFWWCSSDSLPKYVRLMYNTNAVLNYPNSDKRYGLSVRCIKD